MNNHLLYFNLIANNIFISDASGDQSNAAALFIEDEMKEEEEDLLRQPCSSNQSELRSLLVSEEVIMEDEMVIIVSEKGFGKPFNTTAKHALIKRQGDAVSGDMPFNESVS